MLKAVGRGARAAGRDIAGPFRRAGVELGRSADETREFRQLIKALYAAFRTDRTGEDAAPPQTAFPEDTPAARLQTAARCLMWIGAGWQLSLVSGEAAALANTIRGLWVAMVLLWACALLYPRRPRPVEMTAMAAGFAWACWPN